jgi:hypothetical protein
MSYVDQNPGNSLPGTGSYRLAAINGTGNWVRATDQNIGNQTKKFVKGPWNSSYGLGAQGIDAATGTVWAVVNYDADFAVAKFELGMKTSGFVYNRTTKQYSGTLTLTNTGEETIGQVYVSFTNLTSGVTLLNASGTNNGSPYISQSFAAGLKPGASISIPLSFSNPSNTTINFIPVTYRN